ncbi:MAG: DUF362 domain-containing protein [Deltaproteobacteria bacterium]|nr:DUF362 domain-containing protein [Deltaproteobacteria bacterium]
MSIFSRRGFMKGLTVLSSGSFLGVFGFSRSGRAQGANSRVITLSDGQAWKGPNWTNSDLDQTVIKSMIVRGLKQLTGQADAVAALATLIPLISDPAQRYGIKVNCVNSDLPSHPAVVAATVELLVEAGARADNIIVYDRNDHELAACGYQINSGPGCKYYGTNHDGVGLHHDWVNLTNGSVNFSSILTDRIDHIINIPVLKNHTMAGVTLALKNHFGSIGQPEALHGAANDCSPGIAELNAQDQIRNKTRLLIIDALFGNYKTGLYGKPDFAPMSLIVASDPVAADTIGQQLINARRAREDLAAIDAKHIKEAAQLGVGQNDLSNIEHKTIEINPVIEKPKPWKNSGCATAGSAGKVTGLAIATAGVLALKRKN